MKWTEHDCRRYVWIPKEHIVFFQSLLDAEDGLARVRTERQEGDRSQLILIYPSSREPEMNDFMRQFQQAYGITLDSV